MWLSIGAGLSSADAKARLGQEGAKAKTKSIQSKGAATATGTATAAPATPAIDLSQLPFGGKVAVCLLIVAGLALATYFIRQAIIHSQRADAYANA